jgi:hypothetical protein
MESQERKYLIDHGFDVKSPFDAEAVEIIMKDYLEAQTKSQESDSLPCVRIRSFKIRYKRPHHFVKTAIIKGESYAEAKMMFKEMNKDAYDITLSSEKSNEA